MKNQWSWQTQPPGPQFAESGKPWRFRLPIEGSGKLPACHWDSSILKKCRYTVSEDGLDIHIYIPKHIEGVFKIHYRVSADPPIEGFVLLSISASIPETRINQPRDKKKPKQPAEVSSHKVFPSYQTRLNLYTRGHSWVYHTSPHLPPAAFLIWADGLTRDGEKLDLYALYRNFSDQYSYEPRRFFQTGVNPLTIAKNPLFRSLRYQFGLKIILLENADVLEQCRVLLSELEPADLKTIFLVADFRCDPVKAFFRHPRIRDINITWIRPGPIREPITVNRHINISDFICYEAETGQNTDKAFQPILSPEKRKDNDEKSSYRKAFR